MKVLRNHKKNPFEHCIQLSLLSYFYYYFFLFVSADPTGIYLSFFFNFLGLFTEGDLFYLERLFLFIRGECSIVLPSFVSVLSDWKYMDYWDGLSPLASFVTLKELISS